MGTLVKTYPWLDFSLDIRRFPAGLWMKLGEAASKCEHVAGVPLDPQIALNMLRVYLAKGALATTAIEGNTLSEEEAEGIIDGKLSLPPSQKYLETEIRTIVSAFNDVLQDIEKNGDTVINSRKINWFNSLVLKDIDLPEDVMAGQVRRHRVKVGNYSCPDPTHVEELMESFTQVLNEFPSPKGEESIYSLIKAIWAHLNLVWIHPYGDGNGRTARLLELHILLASGFSAPVGHLLSNHYNKTRSKYYEKLDNARRHDNGVIEFIEYSVIGFIDGLVEQINFIRNEQWRTAWINYVHKVFHEKESPADRRRKKVILALTEQKDPVPTSKIRGLSSEIAESYRDKGSKTLTRDVNELVSMGLAKKEDNRVSANREVMIAFMPWRKV